MYRARVEALSEVLRDPDHGSEAFEVIRSFVEQVRITPVNGEVPSNSRANWRASSPWLTAPEYPPSDLRIGHCKSRWLRGLDLNQRPSGYEPEIGRAHV